MSTRAITNIVIGVVVVIGLSIFLPLSIAAQRNSVRVHACTTIKSEALRAQCINPPPDPMSQCNSGASTAASYSQTFPWKQCIADLGKDHG